MKVQWQVNWDEMSVGEYAENYEGLFGATFGDAANPLYRNIVTAALSKVDPASTESLLNATQGPGGYEDEIRTTINGTPQKLIFDTVVAYSVRITYVDGTRAILDLQFVQSTGNHLFLTVPAAGFAATPEGELVIAALEAKPIAALEVLGNPLDPQPADDGADLYIDRAIVGFDNGVISGTEGDDTIDAVIEVIGHGTDRVDGGDGAGQAGTGWQDDHIQAGAGNDSVQGNRQRHGFRRRGWRR